MGNYSKVITFFMENNIQLTSEQLAVLKEEFMDETYTYRNKSEENKKNDKYESTNNVLKYLQMKQQLDKEHKEAEDYNHRHPMWEPDIQI